MAKWYDATQLLSYGKQVSVVIGPRGYGKSYGWKKRAIKKFIKTGKQTVWVRRYKTEVKETIAKFLDDLVYNQEFKGVNFHIDKYELPDIKSAVKGVCWALFINKKPAIIFIPLSISSAFKGSAFPLVEYVVFDEFVIDKSTFKYLSNEVFVFLELLQTIFRKRTVRAMLIGNAISFLNPYFLYWNVKPFSKGFMVTDKVAIEMATSQEFVNEMYDTSFGQLVKGTEYAGYSIDNKFIKENDKFIGQRTARAYNKLGIIYMGVLYGFWFDLNVGLIFVSEQTDPNLKNIYALTNEDHDINLLLVKNMKGTLIKSIVYAFKTGNVRYSDIKVKGQVSEMLSLFMY